MRILILLFAVIILILAIRSLFIKPAKNKPSKPPALGEKMVSCAVCGIHVPESNALRLKEHFFCSEEHLQEWKESLKNES